jgi:hypothetical protein
MNCFVPAHSVLFVSLCWLCFPWDRASSGAEGPTERELYGGGCGCDGLPGGGLHAPQPDLAAGRRHYLGPLREGQGPAQLLPGDQWGAAPGCRPVPVCGHQCQRRQRSHSVAARPRYCSSPHSNHTVLIICLNTKHILYTSSRPLASAFHYCLSSMTGPI